MDENLVPDMDAPTEALVPMEFLNDSEPLASEQEISELQCEAAALEINPLDDGVDLGYDYNEIMDESDAEGQSDGPSALHNTLMAACSNADSPGFPAQVIGGLAPFGAKEISAQAAQMGLDGAVAGAEELMAEAQRTYGTPAILEGVDFIRNADGEPEPIHPLIESTDDAGERVWTRS